MRKATGRAPPTSIRKYIESIIDYSCGAPKTKENLNRSMAICRLCGRRSSTNPEVPSNLEDAHPEVRHLRVVRPSLPWSFPRRL
jgi:hypothetical protein